MIAALVLAASMLPSPHPYDRLDFTDLVLTKMRVSWDCREVLGRGYYDSSRSVAIQLLGKIYDRETTMGYVVGLELLLAESQPRTRPTSELCHAALAALNFRIERKMP